MSGTLYGVGVGPGDPGLLTLAAKATLDAVPVIFAPAPRASACSLAAEIVTKAGVDATKIVPVSFPMSRESAELEAAWSRAAECIVLSPDTGDAAFVTLGDPSAYSTWSYLRAAVRRLRPQASIRTVPGIMAMNAAAARIEEALVEGGETLALLPLPDPVELLDAYREVLDTVVLYKIGGRLAELSAYLASRGLAEEARFVEGVGLDREKVARFADLARGAEGYLSLALVRTRRTR